MPIIIALWCTFDWSCVHVQTCLNRAMGRGDSSGARRSDDDPEVFKKRYIIQEPV